jgi:KDO2-lipid IV(A) lauroyltransferase
MFLKKVEKQIQEAPEFYLWTHKRWKHKKQRPE